MSTNVVSIGPKKCRPFLFEGRFVLPEDGFKFELNVEKSCTRDNDAVWKLNFDLFKDKDGNETWEQIVHISFRSGTPDETSGLKKMAVEGVSDAAVNVISEKVVPVAKAIEGRQPTDAEKTALHNGMSEAVTA